MIAPPERPDDLFYVHPDGTQAKIIFRWGKNTTSIPTGFDITIVFADRKGHEFTLHGDHRVYRSFEQARRQALLLSERIIDLLSEPLE